MKLSTTSPLKPNNYNYPPPQVKPKMQFKGSATSGISDGLSHLDKKLLKEFTVENHLGLWGKASDYLSRTAGESQSILFNAFGTGLVAPIFIAYNPISDQDEKTKKYSALRQPLSAIISVATSLAVNIPVDKWLEKTASYGAMKNGKIVLSEILDEEGKGTGKFKKQLFNKFDLTAKPKDSILRSEYDKLSKQIKKGFTNLNKKQQEYIQNIYGEQLGLNQAIDFKNAAINKIIEDKFNETDKSTFVELRQKTAKKEAGEWLLNKKNIDNLEEKTIIDFLIENMSTRNNKLDLNPRNKKQPTINPKTWENKLKNTKALDFLKMIGINVDEKITEKDLRTFLGKEIYKDKTNVRFTEEERKTISRIAEGFIEEGKKSEKSITLNLLLKAMGIEDEFNTGKTLKMNMTEFLPWFKDHLNIDKVKGKSNKEFAQQIASNISEKAAKDLGAFSKYKGIVLSLAILPAACTFLNWSYPRIMEIAFPSLVKKEGE